jgi:hypothetical protein
LTLDLYQRLKGFVFFNVLLHCVDFEVLNLSTIKPASLRAVQEKYKHWRILLDSRLLQTLEVFN